jgi:UDP-N-acetylmuramate dehydrogenase
VESLINKISKSLKSKFFFNYETKKNVWFQSGGHVSVFCIVYDQNELQIILNAIGDMPYEIIGSGSNFLVRDKGFNGILFKLGKNFNLITLQENCIEVGASVLDANLSKFTQLKNIKNFEFFSGIPGSIGGAIKMNAGCYGSETKDVLKEVTTIDANGKKNILTKSQINLSYRNSILPKGDIIISAKFLKKEGRKEEIIDNVKKIRIMRKDSQPIQSKTSGSTFKNPPNNYAAKLIEMSGCKKLGVGDVYVSDKHANFLINTNNATATQIEELGNIIIDKVYNKFNIKLEWEVKIIGN